MNFLSKIWEKLTRSESDDRLDRYYLRQFSTPTTLWDLLYVFFRKSDYSTITQFPIKFKELSFGISLKDTIKKMGPATHQIKNHEKVPEHHILYYKMLMSGFKVVVQMHFLNDMLVYALYNFRSASAGDINKLFDMLELKYKVDLGSSRDTLVSEIRDKENNKITTKKDINFTLSYIWGSEKPINILKDLATYRRKKIKISDKGDITLADMDGKPDELSQNNNFLDGSVDDTLYNSL